MPEINASLFNGAYLDNAFPSSSAQSDASFDFYSMFNNLPTGSSQEMFISPLESVTPLEMQNPAPPSAHTNAYAHLANATASVPPSTYSASPAPSDFSLSLHAPQPHRMFEAPSQVPAKGPMVNLDVDMAAYTQGLASFNIPMDMGLSYVVPEMPPLSFDISEQMLPMHFKSHSNDRDTCQSLPPSRFLWTQDSLSTTSLMNSK